MPGSCLRHTDIPNTSRLFADFTYHFDRVARFYRHNPWSPDSLRNAAAALDYPADRRAAAVAALREQNPDAETSLALLARPETVAVVTGQQVGLFGGPAYTIYKALTAIRWAETLTAQGIPAVPVFWLATEDHDFPEVNHAWNFNAAMQPIRLEVDAPGAGSRPVGGIAIHQYPLSPLRQTLAAFPHGDDVMALVRESYVDGATLGDAFVALLRRLLPPDSGLLYLDPMKPAIRRVAAPLLARAAAQGPALTARLLERNKELETAGYHSQVHVEPKTSLFFVLENGTRLHRNLSPAEMAARAESLSPNALLRPVVQDYLLPTATLIGGPAEVAYLAQTAVLYEALERPMPIVTARSGFTLLDARTTKLMERYHLALPDVFTRQELLRERIAARLVPSGLQQSIAGTRESVSSALDKLLGEVGAFDPTLGAAAAKSRAKILHQLQKIESKTARQALRLDTRAQSEAAYLHAALYYEKHLQERFYTILPFLARHGFDLVDQLRESVRLECPDHVVLTV